MLTNPDLVFRFVTFDQGVWNKVLFPICSRRLPTTPSFTCEHYMYVFQGKSFSAFHFAHSQIRHKGTCKVLVKVHVVFS